MNIYGTQVLPLSSVMNGKTSLKGSLRELVETASKQ